MASRSSSRIRTGTIQVEGLVELNRALKQLGPTFPKELRKANKTVADLVAQDAKAAAHSIGGVAAHVAPSIKASAGAQFAAVSLGGTAYPMAGGAEFGSYRYKQFKPWRGNGSDAGYFVYPAIRRDADRIETEYGHALTELLDRTGLS